MMEERRTVVMYRIERALESLEEAKILFEGGFLNTFVSRLYYACFYAVSAALLCKGLSSAKHSGIRALFHQHLVRTGLVDQKLGHLYDRLFDNRQKGDYADLVRFDSSDVASWADEAQEFVETLHDMVNDDVNEPDLK